MKNLLPRILLLLALTAVCGCKTHTPKVRNHEAIYQYKAEAAVHWKQMAEELSQRLSSEPELSGNTIFIYPPPGDASSFDLAYYRMLKAELVAHRWKVVETPDRAEVRASVKSQLVPHGQRGYWCFPTSTWCAFGNEIVHFFTCDASEYDWKTRQDLIVTAFVHKDGLVLLGHTQIVFVPGRDASLYLGSSTHTDADWEAASTLWVDP